jgi:hypothetical protein
VPRSHCNRPPGNCAGSAQALSPASFFPSASVSGTLLLYGL